MALVTRTFVFDIERGWRERRGEFIPDCVGHRHDRAFGAFIAHVKRYVFLFF
jgi:hypothetical protein